MEQQALSSEGNGGCLTVTLLNQHLVFFVSDNQIIIQRPDTDKILWSIQVLKSHLVMNYILSRSFTPLTLSAVQSEAAWVLHAQQVQTLCN